MSHPISANQVRAYCDGELDPEQTRAIERQAAADPDLAARIRFERALRESVERTLAEELAAPPELRARVRSALASDSSRADARAVARAEAAPDAAAAAPAPDARPVAAAASPSTGPSTGPRANVFAIAASLALVAGAVLFGIFGKPIDRMSATSGLLADVAQYASAEHQRCAARAENRHAKLAWTTAAAAEPHLDRFLGSRIPIEEIAPAGYQFAGATIQTLPGHRVAAHLIYTGGAPGEDGCPEALLSVFIVPNTGQFETLDAAPWQWSTAGDRPECSKHVLATTDGSLVYFLISCNESRIQALAAEVAE